MSSQAFGLLFVLVLGSAVAQTMREASTQAMRFRAIPPGHPDSRSCSLELRCEFERPETDIVSLHRLSISMANEINGYANVRLAYILKSDTVVNAYEASALTARGNYDNEAQSTVDLTWVSNDDGYGITYRCYAQGYNGSHLYNTYYREITTGPPPESSCDPLEVLTLNVDRCSVPSESVEKNAIELQRLAGSVNGLSALPTDLQERGENLQALSEHIAEASDRQDRAEENTQDIAALQVQISDLSEKLHEGVQKAEEIEQHIQALTTYEERLKQALDKSLSINRVKYDVSAIYNNHIYIASKEEPNFDLVKMNELCQASHGYLAEIGDEDELKFVGEFVDSIGNHYFAIGGNDVDSEGQFVYYNSKTPVPEDLWAKGEPNNLGEEDCVMVASKGLNDIRCNSPWRYVCEIPIA